MNREALRRALFEKNETIVGLARRLKVPATTLSSWVRDVHPGPGDLGQRIERALKLKSGSLANQEAR